jgi:hypothetical protein
MWRASSNQLKKRMTLLWAVPAWGLEREREREGGKKIIVQFLDG